MFRTSMCPSSGEKLLYLCDTGICHTMGGLWSADQTPPIQSDKYQCRIDAAVFLLMMGTWMSETC